MLNIKNKDYVIKGEKHKKQGNKMIKKENHYISEKQERENKAKITFKL